MLAVCKYDARDLFRSPSDIWPPRSAEHFVLSLFPGHRNSIWHFPLLHLEEEAPVDLVEKEGIDAPDIAGLSFQEPFPDHKIIIRGQSFYFHQVEEKLAHLIGTAVVPFVIGQGLAITVAGTGLADKYQGVVIPVAFHKAVQAAPIPGIGLTGHDPADRGFVIGVLGETGSCQDQETGGQA